jgi:CheY-like chemotaxis protein
MERPMRVLLVDDDPHVRALLRLVFEADGYGVVTATDGADALEKAAQQAPDAIVLDLMMPVMTGWEFMQSWRSRADGGAVPIVAISAGLPRSELGDVEPEAFLGKPFDVDRLLVTVEGLVRPAV